MIKRIALSIAAVVGLGLAVSGCANDAAIVQQNLSQAADNFEINRRIVFYNGMTDSYMLTIEGLCSQQPEQRKLTVICKVGPKEYKKHTLGLSDNVTYFSEQLDAAQASTYHYRVTFKPATIIPSVDVR